MPAIATMPAWTPPLQPQETLDRRIISRDSSPAVAMTVSEEPGMDYEELWAMVEKNMGQPLIRTDLDGR